MKSTLQDLIAETPELATLPATTLRLLDLLEEPDVAAEDIREIVELDPTLSADLLKLCNSAYYGLRRRVGTIKEALVLLGNRTVVTLAFAASMGSLLRVPLAAYRIESDELWHHSLATALGASYLIGRERQVADGDRRDRAFLAGLVHDIGKLVLDAPLRGHLERLPVEAEASELLLAEHEILGIDHCQTGQALADAWGFPAVLVEAIGNHHDRDAVPGGEFLIGAVHAANLLATTVGLGSGCRIPVGYDLVTELSNLGADPDDVVYLMQHLHRDLDALLDTVGCTV